ncbi:MAG: acyltransferase domain-containing protein, partial [Myxococcota bacterium]
MRSKDHPRRAGVSSFGFGGSNFHITLEEYVGPCEAPRYSSTDVSLFCLSGTSRALLTDAVRGVKTDSLVEGATLESLAAGTLASFRASDAERLCFVASSMEELRRRLQDAETFCRGDAQRLPGVHCGSGKMEGKVALLFPGQGSQFLEMGAALAMHFPEALSAFDEADDLPLGDLRLSQVLFPTPVFSEDERASQRDVLTQTEWAQPALGATSVAYLRVLRDRLGLVADAYAGHSFGELTALHAAGAYDYGTLLRLARRRGELMAQAATLPGGMVAVSANVERVRTALRDAQTEGVVVANHNAPDQVVISGESAALMHAVQFLTKTGLRNRPLPVATAFHSPLVAPAAAGLRQALEEVSFAPLRAPVFANASARPYPDEPAAQAELLASQLCGEVRFVDQIEAMYAAGVRVFVEVGSGRVLTGLVSRILGDRSHDAVSLDGGTTGLNSFFDGVARLCAAGVPLALELLEGGFRSAPSPLSATNTGVSTSVGGANVGKPQLPAPAPSRATAPSSVVAMPTPQPAPLALPSSRPT